MGDEGLCRDSRHPSHEDLPFVLCSARFPPQAGPLASGFGTQRLWNVGGGSRPAAAALGWSVPRRGPEAGTREMLSPPSRGSSWQAQLYTSLPFQQPVSC